MINIRILMKIRILFFLYDIILMVMKMNEIDKMKLGMWYDANYDKELLDLTINALRLYSLS